MRFLALCSCLTRESPDLISSFGREAVTEQLVTWHHDYNNYRRVKNLNSRAKDLTSRMNKKGIWCVYSSSVPSPLMSDSIFKCCLHM